MDKEVRREGKKRHTQVVSPKEIYKQVEAGK